MLTMHYYLSYAYGPVTVGYSILRMILETATTADQEMTAMGISYAVSDDLSISYGSEIEYERCYITDQEATGISVLLTQWVV